MTSTNRPKKLPVTVSLSCPGVLLPGPRELPGPARAATSTASLTPAARITVLLVLCFVALVGAGYVFSGISLLRAHYENQNLRSEIRFQEARNKQLEVEIQQLSSKDYIEQAARANLGLVYPGETLYIVTEPESDGSARVRKRPGRSSVEICD